MNGTKCQRLRPTVGQKIAILLFLMLLVAATSVGIVYQFHAEVRGLDDAIDVAGEQRYTTVEMALYTEQMAGGEADASQRLQEAADRYDQNLQALRYGGETARYNLDQAPPETHNELAAQEEFWEEFQGQVDTVLEAEHNSEEFRESVTWITENHDQQVELAGATTEAFSQTAADRLSTVQSLLIVLLGVNLLVFFAGVLVSHRHLGRPITRLADTADEIASGALDVEFQRYSRVLGGDEIDRLIDSVAEMKVQLVSALREKEQFVQAVEHAGHSIYITDKHGDIQYVNPAFESISGYDEEAAIGQNPSILKSGLHDEHLYESLWETITDGDVWEGELINQRKNGEYYYIQQTVAPITDETGAITHFVAINSEVTERRVNEQQRQVLNRVLRHNLRNQLNLVDGYAQEILEMPDEQSIRQYIRRMREAIGELIALSEKSQQMESVLEGIETPSPRRVCSIVEHQCESLQQRYPDITVRTHSPSAEWIVHTQIGTVLNEILENAVEHNDRDNREVSITVTPNEPRQHWISITISDNGPGIPAFEREVLEHGRETPLLHGSGIGLWFVNWVIMLAGGRVSISDREPHGTCVTLTIPATPANKVTVNDGEQPILDTEIRDE